MLAKLTKHIELLKNELRAVKFLQKKELQQITIVVIIIGAIAAIGFSFLDLSLSLVVQKFLVG
jgi:preprotein translocase subunit SecE